ncbi:AraC family transcriptional regulator [Paenibacillus xanthanilyticus]|uniref:AraC family transcriptional regulator n=1 Tax=Paenibacillus xanthanilyticus TaxID=1783531 RepID=A0ABV8K0A7_9BACL
MTQQLLRGLSLHYTRTEEVRIAGGTRLELPAVEEDVFGFVTREGVGITADMGGAKRKGKALGGELFLLPSGTRCVLQSTAKQESQVLLIYFTKAWQTPEPDEAVTGRISNIQKLYIFRMPQIRSWIPDFLSAGGTDEALYYQLQSYLYAMASALLTSAKKPQEPEEDVFDYVEQTRKFMKEHFHKPIDVEQIAAQSGFSASRFYQSFRRYTGLSPHKFMTKVRVDASLRLLAGSGGTIMEVAHSVGYTDEFYFSRLFKKHVGLSPKEYSALAKRRVATLSAVFDGDMAVLGMQSAFSVKRAWAEQLREEVGVAEKLAEVAAAQPELILTGPVTAGVYQALSAIAPTVSLDWKRFSWKERLLRIAGQLGMTSVGERWLSYYDMKVENARYHVRRRIGDEPLLLVSAGRDDYRVFGTRIQKLKDLYYDDLQVRPPAKAREIGLMHTDNLQEIAELGCENVLFFVEETEPETYIRELEQRWRETKRSRMRHQCLFVRYREHMNYNAAVHERLVEETVYKLLEIG